MKTMQLQCTATLAVLALGTTFSTAAQTTLKVGDPAPQLQTGKWVQGDPVKEFQKGKAHIVEFWATWCGPCRVSIPHLNEIHNKFKDKGLIVIGQDCWETDESKVQPFVKKMDDKMTYRVALDDKEGNEKGKMATTWMEAAGQSGIPSAFLVDTNGIIAWIGHPMNLKEQVIEEVLAGKFNVKKAAAEYEREKKNELALRVVWGDLNRALQKKNWDEATAKLAEAEKLVPEGRRDVLDITRFSILIGKKDYTAAYQLAAKVSDDHKDNAMLQNQFAWQIATDEAIGQRDLDLAQKMATRANEAAKGKDPGILDTLARVLFLQGQKEEAIEVQGKAVHLAEGELKQSLQKTLDSYKKGELTKAD
jgi:thiol-disulfide isomerase/thioredoxin